MSEELTGQEQLNTYIAEHPAAILYFSGDNCNVCQVLLPKVEALLEEEFPRVGLGKINCGKQPELAAQHSVFAVPTLVLYFDGNESQRFSRNISLGQLRDALARPYQLLFD